ncbi:MAG: type II toxin-antitoxin system HicB family antitoxin [Deltaproteobacteria bacterium]|nr:type II toxin-antitoxin system HicB family antitoxin [Deltaproteobacteria bacterium]
MKRKTKSKKIYKYTAFFEREEEDGGYTAYVPALPGCVSQGDSFEEAQKMIKDAIQCYLQVLEEDGDPIPKEKDEIITAPIFIPVAI